MAPIMRSLIKVLIHIPAAPRATCHPPAAPFCCRVPLWRRVWMMCLIASRSLARSASPTSTRARASTGQCGLACTTHTARPCQLPTCPIMACQLPACLSERPHACMHACTATCAATPQRNRHSTTAACAYLWPAVAGTPNACLHTCIPARGGRPMHRPYTALIS